jgi:hypothetical protein
MRSMAEAAQRKAIAAATSAAVDVPVAPGYASAEFCG